MARFSAARGAREVNMLQFPEVLVLSSNDTVRDSFVATLRLSGMAPATASTAAEGRLIISQRSICVVFCDEQLPDGTYHDVLHELSKIAYEVPVIVLAAFGDWAEYLKALKSGAFDYVGVPLRKTEIERILQNALMEHLLRTFDAGRITWSSNVEAVARNTVS
jgi:two-component system, NtrC family, response regulator